MERKLELLPVCGGGLRHDPGPDGASRGPFPIVHYPVDSHFGRLIDCSESVGTMVDTGGVVSVETAFSFGALHLALAGRGVAWVPHSLCVRANAAGDLVNPGAIFGQVPVDVSLFYSDRN